MMWSKHSRRIVPMSLSDRSSGRELILSFPSVYAESNFRYTQPAFRVVEALDVVEYISSRFVSSPNFFTQSRTCATCTPQSSHVRTEDTPPSLLRRTPSSAH